MNMIGIDLIKKIISKFPSYVPIAFSIAIVTWIFLNMADQRLFFSPFFAFSIPKGDLFDFILTSALASLIGVVFSTNIQYFVRRRSLLKYNGFGATSTSMLPSILATISSGCASCSLSLTNLIISITGNSGMIAVNFFERNQTPITIISIVVLIYSYLTLRSKLKTTCVVKLFQ